VAKAVVPKRKLQRKIIKALRDHGGEISVQSGSEQNALMLKLYKSVVPPPDYIAFLEAVFDLKRLGIIDVVTTTIMLVGDASMLPSSNLDAPGTKRNRRFAVDSTGQSVPAILPPNKVGPLIVTRPEPRMSAASKVESAMPEYHEQLDQALQKLRHAAEENGGMLFGSASEFIADRLGVSASEARTMLTDLKRLGAVIQEGRGHDVRTFVADNIKSIGVNAAGLPAAIRDSH